MSNQIATTILQQLGGNKFAVMTGSKNFIAGKNSLSMKLSRNSSKCNYLRITLNGKDLYDIEFISIRGSVIKTKEAFNDVYNDQLVNIFESTTGLYTRLF
tara:strand:+ start:92 stop:391 length:300 start_codon:yes stop_codon:yes gene_type:complete